MSLIVKRLRLLQKEWGRIVSRETRGGPSQKAIAPTCRDAADEIERLMKQRDERAERYHLALQLIREERERSDRLRDAVRWAYEGGHNDTVDGQYGDPEEVADEIVAELDDEASK